MCNRNTKTKMNPMQYKTKWKKSTYRN